MPMGKPIMSPWANDHDVAHLQAKTVLMYLIWSESAQWLLNSGIHKIPGALIMPMGMPIMPVQENDQDNTHLHAKVVSNNMIWRESAQWLLSSGFHKIPVAFIMPMAMPIMSHTGKWPWCCTSTIQYGSKSLDLEWINPVVAEFRRPQDFKGLYHAHLHSHYAPRGQWPWRCTLIGQDSSNKVVLEWISPMVAEFRHPQDSRSPYHTHGHAHYAGIGKWPRRCTSTCQDRFNELDLERNGPVIAEFRHPQNSKGLYHAHGHARYAPIDQWPWHCISTGQDGFNALGMEWISPVFAEFRHLQDFRGLYHAHWHAHYAPMGKWPSLCTLTGQDSSNELDLEWISPVVTQLRHLQSLGRTNGRADRRTNERMENIP